MRNEHDVYAARPQFWRVMNRMARRLAFAVWWLGLFASQDRPGLIARWISRQMSEAEHFLRCLLVIGAQRVGNTLDADPVCAGRSVDSRSEDIDVGSDRTYGPERQSFSFSLAALGHPAPCPAGCGRTPDSQVPAQSFSDRRSIDLNDATSLDQLTHRLATLTRLIADSDQACLQMARRIARLGLFLRRRPAIHPVARAAIMQIPCDHSPCPFSPPVGRGWVYWDTS